MNLRADPPAASAGNDVAGRVGRQAWCPRLWIVLLSAVALIWVSADILLDGPIRAFDQTVAQLMWDTGVRDDPVAGKIGFIFSQAGGRGTNLAWVVVLCAVIAYQQHTLGPLLRLVVGMILLSAVVYGGKYLFGRTAPAFGSDLLHYDAGQSFPSGHQANALLISGIGAWIVLEYTTAHWLRRLVVGYAIAAPVIAAIAVLLMNYHWFSDVVGGMAVGVILLWTVHVIFAGRLGDLTLWPHRRTAQTGHANS